MTSSSSYQFLPLLEGNSGIGNQCRKWIPHFRSVKWWILELKWGIEKHVLHKVSNILTLNFFVILPTGNHNYWPSAIIPINHEAYQSWLSAIMRINNHNPKILKCSPSFSVLFAIFKLLSLFQNTYGGILNLFLFRLVLKAFIF